MEAMEWTDEEAEKARSISGGQDAVRVARKVVSDMLELIESSEPVELKPNEDDEEEQEETDEEKSPRIDPVSADLDDYFCNLPTPDDDEQLNDDDDSTATTTTTSIANMLRPNGRCDACKTRESLYWRRVTRRLHVCNACFFKKTYLILFSDENVRKSNNGTSELISSSMSGIVGISSSSSNNNNDRKSSKKLKQSNNRKQQDNSSASRPLTRTALNGSKNNNKSQSNSTNATSAAAAATTTTVTSGSSSTGACVVSVGVLTTQASSNSSVEAATVVVDEDSKSTNILVDSMCSIENRPSKNLRKSVRISQSKSKNPKSSKEQGGDENDTQEETSAETKSNNNNELDEKPVIITSTTTTTNNSSNNINNTNRRTKLFKNRRPHQLRTTTAASTAAADAPLVHKIYTQEYAFHRGFFLKIGDIVALRRAASPTITSNKNTSSNSDRQVDQDDDNNSNNSNHSEDDIYFAQIRAFMCDQFGEKSAVITWLIPTTTTTTTSQPIRQVTDFDLSCFTLGPAEEFPRPLDSLEFVCRPDTVAYSTTTTMASTRHRNNSSTSSSSSLSMIAGGGGGNLIANEDSNSNYMNAAGGFDFLNQYKSDLLRHKFDLEDLAAANFRIVTSPRTANGLRDASSSSGSSGQTRVKHEFIMSN